jgi:hypothetical protein
MADDHAYEITVIARDARGDEAIAHTEYVTPAATPEDAAGEMLDHAVKQRGNRHVTIIDAGR